MCSSSASTRISKIRWPQSPISCARAQNPPSRVQGPGQQGRRPVRCRPHAGGLCPRSKSSVVRYRGQIDDQFGVGYARSKAKHHYLEDALDDLLAGRAVRVPRPRVGRLPHRPRSISIPAKGNVTYSNQISRILQARCVGCHRAGEIAPFPLTSYEEAVGWAETIRDVIDDQRMPPWHANPHYGKFTNDARLTDDEKRLSYGMDRERHARGRPRRSFRAERDSPTAGESPRPISSSRCPSRSTCRQRESSNTSTSSSIPVQTRRLDSRRREAGRQPQRRASHGAVLHAAGQNEPQPGRLALPTRSASFASRHAAADCRPMGLLAAIPAGSKLVFQMHYTPNGTEQTRSERGRLRLCRSEKVKEELMDGRGHDFRSLRFPPASRRLPRRSAHDHSTKTRWFTPSCRTCTCGARRSALRPSSPTDASEILLDVPRYDFNWQNVYWLSRAEAHAGRYLAGVRRHFDNSEHNLANPDPDADGHLGRADVERDDGRLVLLLPGRPGFDPRPAAGDEGCGTIATKRPSAIGRPNRPKPSTWPAHSTNGTRRACR